MRARVDPDMPLRAGISPREAGIAVDAEPARAEQGFTLVEMVVALLLGGMVFLGLGYVYALNQGLWMRSQTKLALHANGTRALEEISMAAGHAGNLVPGDGELHLSFPPSPLGHSGPLQMNFRLQDNALTRDGEPLVPSRGDTTLGVAAFDPVLTTLDANGVAMLSVRLLLFTRSGLDGPPDTMAFQTSIHARNLGLGLSPAASAAASAAPGGTLF